MIKPQPFILLVEDDEQLRSTVARALRASGYMVFEARSFREAVEQLVIKPHVMVLDINLPDAKGWKVADWLEQFTSSVPIIVTSGVVPDPKRLEEYKPKAFLPKPFAMNELLNLVKRYAPLT